MKGVADSIISEISFLGIIAFSYKNIVISTLMNPNDVKLGENTAFHMIYTYKKFGAVRINRKKVRASAKREKIGPKWADFPIRGGSPIRG